MNKANLAADDIAQLKDWAVKRMIMECVNLLRTKKAIVLPNDCCIDLNEIKKLIINEL